jgi:signal transduction histidine kinase/ActR/RegA family two-component response regulator
MGLLVVHSFLRISQKAGLLDGGIPFFNIRTAWINAAEHALLVSSIFLFAYMLLCTLAVNWEALSRFREESIKLAHEIEERKKAEAERLQLQERIQRAQQLESLERLAGGVAHNFNNILQGIIGTTEIMKLDAPATSPLLPAIDQIEREAWRATALTKEMLAFSGRGLFAAKQLDLSELVEGMIPLIRTAISNTTDLVCMAGKGLPPIQGDTAQIRQVVLNLVTNASEALEKTGGRVTLSTSLETSEPGKPIADAMGNLLPPGNYVALSVSDSGPGMDETTLKKVFDPFFSTRFVGRGLGLPAVHGIVRTHKGGILIESQPGSGTKVKVFFPATPVESVESIPARIDSLPASKPGTILVVDDEELVRATARRILEPQGYKILEAADGTAAVEILKADPERIQAVLLDLTMRGMDGVGALREMSKIRPDVKVILTSGYSEREVRLQLRNTTVAGFIQKPYHPKDLVSCIERAHTLAGV